MAELSAIDEQLKNIKNADASRHRKHVVILGAGMAGLAAAYELIGALRAVEQIVRR